MWFDKSNTPDVIRERSEFNVAQSNIKVFYTAMSCCVNVSSAIQVAS